CQFVKEFVLMFRAGRRIIILMDKPSDSERTSEEKGTALLRFSHHLLMKMRFRFQKRLPQWEERIN
ncbi:MAG: hypothetical protein IKI34_00275, partial [Eubacterium sp.]|nr:hypothetical protein [Eubacterium sp.]